MKEDSNIKFSFSELIILILILSFAFFMAYIPHLNYPYPVHWDEWRNISYSNAIIDSGSGSFFEPFYGLWKLNLISTPETGFFILLGIIQQVTGISVIILYNFLPGIIFMITVLSVYAFARRQGFGIEAAFLTCLIPTTSGILGPGFLVALATGIMFIPLFLLLAFQSKKWQSYLLLFIFTSFLFLIHPPTASAAIIILVPYIALNLKGNFKHSLGLILSLGIPALVVSFAAFRLLVPSFEDLLTPQSVSSFVSLPPLLQLYGYLPLVLAFVGIIYLVYRGSKINFGLVLGLLALLVIIFIFFRLGYGISIFYERSLTIMLLMLSIVGGAGLKRIGTIRFKNILSTGFKSLLQRNFGNYLSASLVIIILVFSIPAHLNTSYYHIIDSKDYQTFTWIKNNLKIDKLALMDPWKANSFVALTQNHVVSRLYLQAEPADIKIYEFLVYGCLDSSVIIDNIVSLIYNLDECGNSDLIKIRDNIYVVNASQSSLLWQKNMLQNSGFEHLGYDKPYPWWNWSENSQPIFLFPETGLSGAQSIGIKMVEKEPYDPWPQALWAQTVPVTTGKSYLMSGWIKTDNITGYGGAMFIGNWTDQNDQWLSSSEMMKYIKGTNNWAYFQGVVTAPPAASKCGICCYTAGCSGTAWFDEITFREINNEQ